MNSNHTQGPWSVEYDGSLVLGGQVCATPAPDTADRDERRANARLIAAAPELLEALVGLVEASTDDESARWHYKDGRRIDGFRDSCPMCVARAAIMKAVVV